MGRHQQKKGENKEQLKRRGDGRQQAPIKDHYQVRAIQYYYAAVNGSCMDCALCALGVNGVAILRAAVPPLCQWHYKSCATLCKDLCKLGVLWFRRGDGPAVGRVPRTSRRQLDAVCIVLLVSTARLKNLQIMLQNVLSRSEIESYEMVQW